MHLEITAYPAETFSISAQGRNAKACGRVEGNLILETYRQILAENNCSVQPLRLEANNGIPLGMGCGSSAAARLAGIALAVEFGEMAWQEEKILATATRLEGHPDNVTACWLGGMTVAAVASSSESNEVRTCTPPVHVARFEVPEKWRAVVVLPKEPLQTEESRKVLPERYSRDDIVTNLQHSSLLVAAFATGQDALLQAAMRDRLHEPYRKAICPLLERLQPLAGKAGVLGVVLSGAGPGVLLIVEQNLDNNALDRLLTSAFGSSIDAEILQCGFENRGANNGGS